MAERESDRQSLQTSRQLMGARRRERVETRAELLRIKRDVGCVQSTSVQSFTDMNSRRTLLDDVFDRTTSTFEDDDFKFTGEFEDSYRKTTFGYAPKDGGMSSAVRKLRDINK